MATPTLVPFAPDAQIQSFRGLVRLVVAHIRSGSNRACLLQLLTVEHALTCDDARLVLSSVTAGLRAKRRHAGTDGLVNELARLAYDEEPSEDALFITASPGSSVWHTLLATCREDGVDAALTYAASADFQVNADHTERATVAWWRGSLVSSGERVGPTSIAIARGTLTISDQMTNDALRASVLRRLNVVLARAIEDCLDAVGVHYEARPYSREWYDAIALAECTRALARSFAEVSDVPREAMATHLCLRITRAALGGCKERVGKATLESARLAVRHGDLESARALCDQLIETLGGGARFRFSDEHEVPQDEHVLVLQQLVEAIEVKAFTLGVADPASAALHAFCLRVLARACGTDWDRSMPLSVERTETLLRDAAPH